MTASAHDPPAGEPMRRAPVGPAGMDGIARLAARLSGATAAVVLGQGEDRRIAAVAGGDQVAVLGAQAAAPRLVAPLVAPDGSVRGALEIYGESARDSAAEELLHDLAAQAVALLELHRTTSELVRTAGRDQLTGLANRRSLEQALSSAIARAERGLGTPSVVVIDIDGCAGVEQGFGAAAGEAVLRSVAERLVSSARAVDTVARIGSRSFGVLLEHTGGSAAVAAVTRLRESVADTVDRAVDPVTDRAEVTAAVGLATYRPGDSVASLVSRADAELYAERARTESSTNQPASR